MHIKCETFGDIIKSARQNSGLTIESLADKIGISTRYLYRLENDGKKPSYDVLYKIIRTLSISPDQIFYPEKATNESEIENLIRMLYSCDRRTINVITATVKALSENFNEAR